MDVCRFFLAEDCDDDVYLIRKAVAESGLGEVAWVARDGAAAIRSLTYLASSPPDVVILDVNLPIRNGFEILVKMVSINAYRQVPIMMLSSSMREEDIRAAYEGGGSAYLYKPSDYEELSATLKPALRYFTRQDSCERELGESRKGSPDLGAFSPRSDR